jgi:hypothetical protein
MSGLPFLTNRHDILQELPLEYWRGNQVLCNLKDAAPCIMKRHGKDMLGLPRCNEASVSGTRNIMAGRHGKEHQPYDQRERLWDIGTA